MLSTSIKEATRTAHQDLEKRVVTRLKTINSNEDYADLLKYFYAYFSGVENAIRPFITEELLPDYKERRNSSFIKADIEALGADVNDLPPAIIPQIGNTLQALGALYVMEGSIMGGSIIVKMLEKMGITQGVSFFSGYGEATGEKWALFTEVMNKTAQTPEDEEVSIKAANDTFSCFADTFDTVKAA
ncbi:biliverdin-producing heme oxygenase [Pararcticibacter amylolyticus]|uniref:Heme oxygenase n=1 Tax=Pararcticibacter amylolyticus TaxID=2173175 RepID=A0A2U2PIR5_9SPHI|nr:biliverdin-producing heme oxygenase [Pararcticibacter amylolyticus]PWG81281.1 heme oxygenase [Pararcticibacter amylolyticus]